jgi:integrase
LKSEVKLAPIEALLGEIEGKVWTLPAERMKGGKEHRVPLSAPAMVIVEEMRREYSGDMLSRTSATGRRAIWAMGALGERAARADLTAHGFRSTFRDWAAERTDYYSNEVVEMVLARTIRSKVEASYRRGDLFDKRRLLMADRGQVQTTRENGCADVDQPARMNLLCCGMLV